MNRFRALFHKPRLERDLDDEIACHLSQLADDYARRGMSPKEAMLAARRDFGGIEPMKEIYRDRRGLPWIETSLQDLRHGIRALRRNPAFSLAVIATLAIAIGANTALFSVVESVILRPLPYKDADRLAIISDAPDLESIYSDYEVWREQSHSFTEMAVAFKNSGVAVVTLTGPEPEFARGGFVSADFFPLLGVAPAAGRFFTTAEEKQADRVVILSDALWQRRFQRSADALGATLEIGRQPYRIIGVMPAAFQFPERASAFWAPITTNRFWNDPALRRIDPDHARGFYTRFQVLGRLRPGVSLDQARSEIGAINAHLRQTDPRPYRGDGAYFGSIQTDLKDRTRLALLILMGAVGCVLLIACTNVANLVLARGAARLREMAVRTALGAGRGRLIRQLFTESLVLAVIAAGLGLVLAQFGIRALVAFGPADIPRLEETSIDRGVLLFAVGAALLSAALFGLAPAWKIARRDLHASMKPARTGARGFLVIAEVALSVVLLTGAGLLVRSLLAVMAVDPGFEKNVLSVRVSWPMGTPAARQVDFHRRLGERLRALPHVESAAAIDTLFEFGQVNLLGLRAIQGRELAEARGQWTELIWKAITGDYFQTVGSPVVRGRSFTSQDGAGAPLVAVIDESMARRYWPGEDPVGARIKGQDKRGPNDEWVTIVGVVRDSHRQGLEKQPTPHVFVPSAQYGSAPEYWVVRAAGDPVTVAGTLRSEIRALDGSVLISRATTLEEQLSGQLSPRRFQTGLLALFSALALALAGIGIYGLMHYSVSCRRREIGIRMALGARGSDVSRMVIRQGLALALAGVAAGLVAAALLTRLLDSFLFGVRAGDPLTHASVAALLLVVALASSALPAWRASIIDPLAAVRHE